MGVRKCIIKDCPSTSARSEDRGVTYHKIPANESVKKKWVIACQLPDSFVINKGSNVCSRHFRKADFQDFKGTKYVLKFGAVPTIFSWTIASAPSKKKKDETEKGKSEEEIVVKQENVAEESFPVKIETSSVEESEEKIVVKQDPEEKKEESIDVKKEANDDKKEIKHEVADDDIVLKDSLVTSLIKPKRKSASKRKSSPKRATTARVPSAKKLRKSEPPLSTSKDKKTSHSPRKSTSATLSLSQSPINFTPGTKIEAQDFAGKWHPAKLGEVDTEDREVLVQFEKNGKNKSTLNDEWIPMDSVRLRPLPSPKTPNEKIKFVPGEKCFARWSDSRKFRATVQTILDNDMYEVLFDDGFVKVCKAAHISKLKRSEGGFETDMLGTPIKQEEDGSTVEVKPPVTPITPISATYIPQIAKASDYPDIPRGGEWCCHWMNDFPIGEEAIIEVAGVKIHSVIVPDWRLPEGWIKHIYQRITAYGKMDVLLVTPEGKVFRSRQEMKAYFAEKGEAYDLNMYDFGLHKKRAKELGFCHYTKEYKESLISPKIKTEPVLLNTEINIGSVKVKIIDNLLQCPEPYCLKTFRKENHLQIHIKHYHKELAKGLGEIPNMQDLAALRTPVEIIDTPPKMSRRKSISLSTSRVSLKEDTKKEDVIVKKEPGLEENAKPDEKKDRNESAEGDDKKDKVEMGESSSEQPAIADSFDIKSPKPEISATTVTDAGSSFDAEEIIESHSVSKPRKGVTKIKLFTRKKKKATKKNNSGHISKRAAAAAAAAAARKKKRKLKLARNSLDYMEAEETRHSFAVAGTSANDSFYRHGYGYDKDPETSQTTNASICGQYGDDSINAAFSSPRFISENGEVIKIVSMKKEEIINCLCGYGEEDGLMVQCELCLCWQHGICNGFERDNQVPDKYVCYICRNPQGVRESRRYMHDQDWLYEGKLPVANYHVPNPKHASRFDILKQSHTLGGNLLELKRFMHSLKVKINIAEKKDHPKMYLWSKKWEKSPPRGGNGDLSGIVPLSSATGTATASSHFSRPKPNPVPQIPIPEAAIDPAECQAILLEHIQKQQNAAMARLQAIEAQIIALEAYDEKPELLESPTAKNYPKTKQTIHMLLNDLIKMKKIAAIHRSAQQPLY
ncbi:uncharacterized protein LOC131689929 [Topomyia yanbarensis]|uniref:uncharacterized protein LOC131689929 n=1 Tax=Topomyia yanbarensis TaxID=2498891 RepID=UPI00273B82B3|nr:uncharacterized protein LOC131689929 [Topomyia yanbarensis]